MKHTKAQIENRISSLKRNPVTNAKLIKKWERYLRKADVTNG